MDIQFFNYSARRADGYWDRSSFIRNWWRIDARDPGLAPPFYPVLRRELEPERNPHLRRMSPHYLYLEAFPRHSARDNKVGAPDLALVDGLMFETPVAAAIGLGDPRRSDGAAYFALLRCANDLESLERLVDALAAELSEEGFTQLIGPTGLSPHLGTGLLQDSWDRFPPLYTPYNPPHLSETVAGLFELLEETRLYELEISPEPEVKSSNPAEIISFEPERLAGDLYELFTGVFPPTFNDYAQSGLKYTTQHFSWGSNPSHPTAQLSFPPPDQLESAFLLRWLSQAPLSALAALYEGQLVGFILLCPDLAPFYNRSRGGKNMFWRLWLRGSINRPTGQGRILFGGVLPDWRGRGIDHQLLSMAMRKAAESGWRSVSVGPISPSSSPARFLEACGFVPKQRYGIYHYTF